MYIIMFATVLTAMLVFVALAGRYRHAIAAITLLAVWIGTVAAQRFTGDFAPYPVLAAIDLLAAASIFFRVRYRWEVALLGTFVVDLVIHNIFHLTSLVGVHAYLDALAVVAYGQLFLVGGMAWHARRGFDSRPAFLRWLHADFVLRRGS